MPEFGRWFALLKGDIHKVDGLISSGMSLVCECDGHVDCTRDVRFGAARPMSVHEACRRLIAWEIDGMAWPNKALHTEKCGMLPLLADYKLP